MTEKKSFLILMLLLAGSNLQSQSVLGAWKAINEESGKAMCIIEIYEVEGQFFGKIKKIIKEEDRGRLCTKCEGDLKDMPIEGMVVMDGLEKDGNYYVGGTALDPKSGREYRCKIWLDETNPDILKIRGYLAIFYRTQTWVRDN
ncbi:MAG TPA: DUF2147 domain-containing protein [Gillisia sp.]|nr:DUF2147 domain-containing protein [Gillisia sp.]